MPYDGQQAGKRGHADLIKNKDVADFLGQCTYIKAPGPQEGEAIADTYLEAAMADNPPGFVAASDSSPFSDPISKQFPSTQVGYVKTSLIGFDMHRFDGLYQQHSNFVDPHAVAAIHNDAHTIAFTLPGSNLCYKGTATVQDGFRLAVFEQFSDNRTRIDTGLNIAEMLLFLEGGKVKVSKCPRCGAEHCFIFSKGEERVTCPGCQGEVFLTDALRLHEQISDHGDNSAAITRFMNAAEHLQVAVLVKFMADKNLEMLADSAIMLDGPLALFGQPAKFHASLQWFYNDVFDKCRAKGLASPVIMGLQKEGQVMEHARSLAQYLKPGTFSVVSDAYRDKYINGIPALTENFGHETYYGQDFIFKTAAGQIFDFCLAYPLSDKKDRASFAKKKAEPQRYAEWLPRAFKLIDHLQFDLYQSAVVPIALAHRHASISLKPGGTMLKVLAKKHLEGK
ncbi:hypothetical protein [Cupriavidus taiwanensis]|uniref:hypothetical protein n=1 Tax=Cupriavidus taiwanensis TaxID=164546 RepID=UPI000E108339|nr:hypothetical protein [Cupriavidus taiwanensis]SOY39574.1 conserved hypothetical protein [Cupriavidus taiwanensis]SOY42389.1 conserved hypothetical protein [Cupriavidus taiwanensis]SOY78984.1 conserved hypothetical protein [Cupriavidus taiwanensis]SOZ50281.1 conserved hypothetical protein [Cupriavidus taiwanensis]SOZ75649.1 conserved hypothetical protein [Cupriavidus taiwanensis]